MKSLEVSKKGMILIFILAAIFLAMGIGALFIPDENIQDEQSDTIIRYIMLGIFSGCALCIIIGGFATYAQYKREYNAFNDFIKQCGENAVALPSIHFKTDDPQIYKSAERALKTGDTSIGLAKMSKSGSSIHYAVICDDGIYFIPLKGIGTPKKNIFYKRDCLPHHTLTVNPMNLIVINCPDIKILFSFSVKDMPHITHNELLERLNDLYGNTLQINDI